MKTKIVPILALFILFTGCEESVYREYKGNAPVYMAYEELRNSVATESGRELVNPGKIYFKDNYIFIIEELEGFHVYDNTNPAAPVHKTFVKVPGAIDISISGYIIYVDSYVDLVVLDAEDINNIHEVARTKDVFPYVIPETGNEFPVGQVDPEKGVVVGYDLKLIREKVDISYPVYPVYYDGLRFMELSNAGGASSGVSGSGVGIGGSMARFGIKGNVLYAVDNNSIKVFDISDKVHPSKFTDVGAWWGIETMFLTDDYMFLGTTTGMAIFSLSIPLNPSYISFYSHFRSCDPVVIDGDLAYATLRTGTTCGGTASRLDVVDINNITSPVLLQTYPMTNPYGLAKDGDLLFVCDGTDGLKIYNASDPMTITQHLLYSYPSLKAYDAIPIGAVLVMIGDDGLYQYDYSDPANITRISHIGVAGE
ncbi:MAG TPA: hypothetical protein VMV74_02845 [Bacteroidales bacterium]|nr:hypothetical protein [Bacteroidales bacterium]